MRKILLQLDTDPLPSTFDRVVAVDAGVDDLFSYGGITPENVEALVHGAVFTRKPGDLKNTAIFIGGSLVTAGEAVWNKVLKILKNLGPMRVSVMMDSNGSNTTAAAAVLAAMKHLDLSQTTALVLGGTGPVGCRAAQLLVGQGATVRVGSRTLHKAHEVSARLATLVDPAKLVPCATVSPHDLASACDGVQLVIAAGAAGVEILSAAQLTAISGLKVAIDLNAVPPAGLGGIQVFDKAVERNGVIHYGAIGVGGTKMKIHTAAIRRLFESNDANLDTNSLFQLAQSLS